MWTISWHPPINMSQPHTSTSSSLNLGQGGNLNNMPRPHLAQMPTEILYEILQHLAPNINTECLIRKFSYHADGDRFYYPNRKDIQSARLTCRTLNAVATSILFRSIKISYLKQDLLNFTRVAFSPSLRMHVKMIDRRAKCQCCHGLIPE